VSRRQARSLPPTVATAAAPDRADRDEGPPARDAVELRDVLEWIGLIITPATLLGALGFYFGWRRTNSFAIYFGIDQSLFDYDTRDYVIRSLQTAYSALFTVVVTGLVALWVHATIMRLLIPGRWLRPLRVLVWTLLVGTALVLIASLTGLLDELFRRAQFLTRDAVLAFGVALLLYWLRLRKRVSDADAGLPRAVRPRWMAAASVVLAMLLVFSGLFSATERYAGAVGRAEAEYLASRLRTHRGVVVYSTRDLGLPSAVRRTVLPGREQAYRYRYDGLRLFVRTGGRYLLLPATWSRADDDPAPDIMIVLPDDGTLRFEFTPGTG
jgi:hypothetical protein